MTDADSRLAPLVHDARMFDSAAQGADQEFYAALRGRAFGRRQMARDFLRAEDRDR